MLLVLLVLVLELSLLVAGRQVGDQRPVQIILSQVQRLVQEGHVVLVVEVAERRLEVKERTPFLGLDAVIVRLPGLRARQQAVGDVLETRVPGVVVSVVKVEAKLVDVSECVDGRRHAADLTPRGRGYVRLAGVEHGTG